MSNHSASEHNSQRVLWWGIGFSFAFTLLIWIVRPLMPTINFLPDTGYAWYYWKLPDPTFATRAAAWGGYFAHQVFAWWTIYYAQNRRLKYSANLQWINYVSLGGHALFITLHLLKTLTTYDGLAQDVSISSSQASVVIMLVLVLLMENQRRGLFFGQKVGFVTEAGRVIRKYHGYIFAWGIIYTFWYHPMEATSGHLLGFLYTFLLLVQGGLIFTRAHVNRIWTTMLEVAVLIHGTLVAIATGVEVWPMFMFGFAGIFIVTQMHGIGLKAWHKWGFLAVYVGAVLAIYSQRGWELINEVLRIPIIEYALVLAIAAVIWIIMKASSYFVTPRTPSAAD